MTRGRALIAAAGVLVATTGCAQLATTETSARNPSVVHDIQSRYTVQMAGRVTHVNARAGQLTLTNGDGAMTLRFPSEALQSVQVGDHVVVAAGLLNVGSHPPSASPRTEDPDDEESVDRPPRFR